MVDPENRPYCKCLSLYHGTKDIDKRIAAKKVYSFN